MTGKDSTQERSRQSDLGESRERDRESGRTDPQDDNAKALGAPTHRRLTVMILLELPAFGQLCAYGEHTWAEWLGKVKEGGVFEAKTLYYEVFRMVAIEAWGIFEVCVSPRSRRTYTLRGRSSWSSGYNAMLWPPT